MTISNKEAIDIKIEIWKKTIDVQMHFNELEMKIRNFAILVISAFVGGAGLALKEGMYIANPHLSLAAILLFAAAFIAVIFYFADRFWYHPLLIGSVTQGLFIEQSIVQQGFPEISLTKAIGDASGVNLFGSGYKIRSKQKIGVFYLLLAATFVILGLAANTVSPSQNSTKPESPKITETAKPLKEIDEQAPLPITININNNSKASSSPKEPEHELKSRSEQEEQSPSTLYEKKNSTDKK